MHDIKEEEILRIREGIVNGGLVTLGSIHPREASIAYIVLALEIHLKSTDFTREQIKHNLHGMVDFVVDNTTLGPPERQQ